MKSFLEQVAAYVFDTYKNSPEETTFVFPNRRAGIFFREYLSIHYDRPVWSPRIITISELFHELSGFQLSDRFNLLFELYDEYLKLSKTEEKFDKFYFWGEMLLNDFNDIDKNMVDAKSLFMNLIDLKSIDEHYTYLDESQIQAIKQFWSTFEVENISNYQKDFISIWERMFLLYTNFKKRLSEQGVAYEGMIFRQVVEKYKDLNEELPVRKLSFVGLNALNKCEEQFMELLQRQNKAEFFWDYDTYYSKNEFHEAGRFIRENLTRFPSPAGFHDESNNELFNNIQGKKSIKVYAVSSTTGQAKIAYSILKSFEHKASEKADENAIILPDEKLLLPVLHSIPEEYRNINITMGYPVTASISYSFVESLLDLQKLKRVKNNSVSFYHKTVLGILGHRFISQTSNESYKQLALTINKQNYIYVDQNLLQEIDPLFKLIFSSVDDTLSLASYLKDCLYQIFLQLDKDEAKLSVPVYDKEIIYLLYTTLNRLHDLFEKRNIQIELNTFIRFLKQASLQLSLPFSGEPLSGLQIMGILETRALDFKNIIIPSMNEGMFPKSNTASSFIPYNLRKGFGLPVQEHQDSIYAYYFYRLLQRAQNIHLLYDSQSSFQTGDMSRYLYQLSYDPKVNVQFVDVNQHIKIKDIKSLEVEKTPEMLKKLHKYIDSSEESYLSPSALNTYQSCSLRFYFQNIAGLRPTRELNEEVDNMIFGNILHKSMEALYKPFLGKVVTADILSALLKDKSLINESIEKAFREEFYKTKKAERKIEFTGRNILVFDIIKKYIKGIIEIDKKHTPFTVTGLEKNLSIKKTININGKELVIRVGGNIDRIDFKDGIYRIIDYKTGKAENAIKSIDELFEPEKSSDKKGIFQLLVYSQLFKNSIGSYDDIRMGLFVTKELFKKDYKTEAVINKEILSFNKYESEFDNHFINLLSEIFNSEINFTQTENKKNCEYCDYKDICMR